MPIYAYRCSACGRAKDVLQKMSDPVLTECPFCGEATFVKQVTAAGFQLKGSGWYVTDFRGDSGARKSSEGADGQEGGKADLKSGEGKAAEGKAGEGKSAGDGKGSGESSTGTPTASPAKSDAGAGAAASPAPSPAPAGGGAGPVSK